MSETQQPRHLAEIDCAFTRGYVAAAFFSTRDETSGMDETLEQTKEISDLAPATWAAVQRDCAAFLAANRELIEACEEHHKPGSNDDDAMSHAGRDFWYGREGHGAGFWDGDWPQAAGEHLDRATKAFGSADWYLGDDGKIYQSGDERPHAKPTPALEVPGPAVFPSEGGPALA